MWVHKNILPQNTDHSQRAPSEVEALNQFSFSYLWKKGGTEEGGGGRPVIPPVPAFPYKGFFLSYFSATSFDQN